MDKGLSKPDTLKELKMKSFFLALTLSSIGLLANPAYAIIGGQPANPEDDFVAFTVGFVNMVKGKPTNGCTAVLISDSIALTAAHCVHLDAEQMFLAFVLTKAEVTPAKMRPVINYAFAPGWKPDNLEEGVGDAHDIAVVQFAGGVPAGYQAANLLKDPKLLQAGQDTVIAGFGVTDGVLDSGGGILRSVTVAISNPKFSKGEVTIAQTDSAGSCHGDSGGPAFLRVGGKPVVWGISSAGVNNPERNCKTGESTYTAIHVYKKWIEKTIKQF